MLALRQVVQAQGDVAGIARKAKLTHEATYKMLSKIWQPGAAKPKSHIGCHRTAHRSQAIE
jgi:DNA-binding phage protein